jgi:hypothetical protein
MAETSKNRLNVTELDFDQIRANLKTYMQGQTKFQDYDFEGSALSTVLDVLAYNTFYNAFNANMMANEMYLDTAQVRNNVVSHAKSLGYVPRSSTSAFASIDVIVNTPTGTPTSLTIDRGTVFTSKIGNKTYSFANTEAQTITPVGGVYRFNDLIINQGVVRTFEYTVDNTDTTQKFEIPDSTVDTATLKVTVRPNRASTDTATYARVENVVEVDDESQVYFLQEGLDGKYEVYFGDGIFGKSLQAGNVVKFEYLITDAEEANGASVFSLQGNISGNTNVTIITNDAAAGGAQREDIQSIKFNAPLSFLSQNRVVTADDYSTIIKNNYSNAETVAVWGGEENEPPEYGKVYISIKPKSGETLDATQKQFIIDNILKSKNIVSITPEIIDPSYTYIWLQTFFKYNPNLTTRTSGELTQLVYNVISDYNDLDLKKFDGVFRQSKLLGLIDSADPSILNSTIRVYMQKRLIPEIGVSQKYELQFSSPIYTTSSDETIITSSPFYLNGKIHYIESYQSGTTDRDHKLRIYRLINNLEKAITVSDAGYVDPTNGLVVLTSFNPDSLIGGSIEINAEPDSNDIAPKLNQLLQINMDSVTVEPQIDTIATGGVIAGIGYQTVSRHDD